MQTSAVVDLHKPHDVIAYPDGSADFAFSPEFAAHYEHGDGVLWTRFSPQGIPSFNLKLLEDLDRGSRMIEAYFSDNAAAPLHYAVLRSACPTAFSVGGDLGYFQRMISAQDRAGLTDYARRSIDVVYRNYTAHNLRGVTTIALLEADALGGGFECALSCDLVIMERHVKAGFPEILFDMFPGMGGMSFLARRVGRATANELLRTGRQYTAQELLELGVVDQVVPTGEGRAAVMRLIRKRENQLGGQAAINTIDRMVYPVSLQELHDIVKIWVDRAMQLSPRAQEWMQRLYQRQLAIFGRPLESAQEPADAPLQESVAAAA